MKLIKNFKETYSELKLHYFNDSVEVVINKTIKPSNIRGFKFHYNGVQFLLVPRYKLNEISVYIFIENGVIEWIYNIFYSNKQFEIS